MYFVTGIGSMVIQFCILFNSDFISIIISKKIRKYIQIITPELYDQTSSFLIILIPHSDNDLKVCSVKQSESRYLVADSPHEVTNL